MRQRIQNNKTAIEMPNKSESIREFIRDLFNQSHDFSNRELNKTKFVEHFESEANKPLGITWKEHQTLFVDQFKSVCKEKSISPSTYGYAKEKKTFASTGTEKQWDTQPKPKQVAGQTNLTQNPGIKSVQSAGHATQSEQKTETITPLTEEESFRLCRIIGKTAANVINAKYEKFTPLDDAEADELGAALNPILKPYLEKYGGKVMTLLFVGGSIVAKRKDAFKKDGDKSDTKPKDTPPPPSSKPAASDPTSDAPFNFEQWKKEQGMLPA